MKKYTVVLAHGCFDLLHLGHIEHLKQAKAMGNRLVVSVVADEFMPETKAHIYSEDERMAMLRAVRYVDQVLLCKAPGPEGIIERLRPDVYARGTDYEGSEMPESVLLRALGIQVRYTKSLPIHTRDVIERLSA